MIKIPEGMSVEVTIYYHIDGMNGSSSYGRIRGQNFTGGSLLEIRDRYLGKLCKMIGHPVSLCSKEEHDANVYEKDES